MQANTRVVGSNYSIFRYRGKAIAYLETVNDAGTRPVAAVEPIHPLGEDHPVEFATPRAMNAGSLRLTIRELWQMPVWQHLSGLATAQNIIDVWMVMAQDPAAVTAQTIIRPPQGNYLRVKTYHNLVVSDIDDSETIDIGSMTIARQVTMMYTHATRAIISA